MQEILHDADLSHIGTLDMERRAKALRKEWKEWEYIYYRLINNLILSYLIVNVHYTRIDHRGPELLQENYFHAVFEATKSIADKIRDKANLTNDGAELVDIAFGLGKHNQPKLAFNTLQTESELSEHKGFSNLLS